jgi:hypothetical protein
MRTLRKRKMARYQKESVEYADRYKFPIEDWEIDLFIRETSDIQDIDRLFTLAIDLKRTFNAMRWWWVNTYKAKANGPHHAKAIIERIKRHKEVMI